MKNAIIHLKELPSAGEDVEFTNKTGELNATLRELIEHHDYRATFHLAPLGNAYELKGEMETTLPLLCSVCANSFTLPVRNKLHEYLIIESAFARGERMAKTNHAHEWENEGPDYIVLENDHFDVAAYIHEIVALLEPMRPLCAPQLATGCTHSAEKIQRNWLAFNEEGERQLANNPFQVLEKIKLKS
jgi:uncharacterized metal-binding protein YceD (DUF177 family)